VVACWVGESEAAFAVDPVALARWPARGDQPGPGCGWRLVGIPTTAGKHGHVRTRCSIGRRERVRPTRANDDPPGARHGLVQLRPLGPARVLVVPVRADAARPRPPV